MNSTAVLSARHGELPPQAKAVKCYSYIRMGWEPTTSQVAEMFAITYAGALSMLENISIVEPIFREEPASSNFERGRPAARWRLLQNGSPCDRGNGRLWQTFDNE